MADRVFVDTSVLLPSYFPELESREVCRACLERLKNEGVELSISGQVIREFYVRANNPGTFEQATVRDRALPLEMEPLLRIVESMPLFFEIVDQPHAVHELLPQLLRKYEVRGKRTHDTNILATMLVHGLDTICSLDRDFENFSDRVNILSPLAEGARKSEDSG
ncbi:MAG: type II toxin-antitoxin system VapC family toxin [Anaerolineaceae bacterium]|nr:type II toxin-antitoxin system VapC family toxin [Anaerolineaceae bacterium]MDE0608325.1 type II toxin-antitoxin system VapC family toxin [Anaerolineaceae bacterium]MDE0608328.1 type II toxin-antitoxin system VapC family toxin [Anaerolineaceae bacterium]